MPGLRGTIGPLPKGWSVSGGTITTPTVNGIAMKVHTFTATGSSTLTVNGPLGLVDTTEDYQATLPIDYLILGGGGGGGGANNFQAAGGGGGPGGFKTGAINLAPGAYTIVVGAGGAGGATGFNNGLVGGDSSAFGITANGGGGGGYSSSGGAGGTGGNGANGGGGGNDAAGGTSTNVSTPAQGSSIAGQQVNGIGFGGMGASLYTLTYPVVNSSSSQFLPIGSYGAASSISGVVTMYARPGFALSTDSTNRAPNTGDGGRGGWVASGNVNPGFAGGSGVVIISYLV